MSSCNLSLDTDHTLKNALYLSIIFLPGLVILITYKYDNFKVWSFRGDNIYYLCKIVNKYCRIHVIETLKWCRHDFKNFIFFLGKMTLINIKYLKIN